jgi:glucokinase
MTPPSGRSDSRPRVLADIGGTNARFAWQDGPGAPLRDVEVLRGADHPTLEAALREYLRQTGHAVPRDCAIAMANPVTGDWVSMTNHSWAFSIGAMLDSLGLERLVVLNDFTALALSLPSLAPGDLRQVGGGESAPDAARGVIGPGTGLGVSGLLPDGRGGWVPLKGEGGHVTLAARTVREQAVLARLEAQHGHASAERAVSGPGLADVYRALAAIDGDAASEPTPEDITTAARDATDPRAVEAVNLLCAFLGTVAGNLALTLGALGGIYIAGGIVPRLGKFFDASPFRARFEDKGRFSAYVAEIPTYVIVSRTSPALIGVQFALDSASSASPRTRSTRPRRR